MLKQSLLGDTYLPLASWRKHRNRFWASPTIGAAALAQLRLACVLSTWPLRLPKSIASLCVFLLRLRGASGPSCASGCAARCERFGLASTLSKHSTLHDLSHVLDARVHLTRVLEAARAAGRAHQAARGVHARGARATRPSSGGCARPTGSSRSPRPSPAGRSRSSSSSTPTWHIRTWILVDAYSVH